MKKLYIDGPVSGGILLSYRCAGGCQHCMYACSPRWSEDWIPKEEAERVLTLLAGRIQASSYGRDGIGINSGLHFTGGEPFLNFDLLKEVVRTAHGLGIPSTFVETSCFWCVDDETTRKRLVELKDAGLNGILVSVNPFILEKVPFERTERCARVSKEVFGWNVIIYQEFFYDLFRTLGLKNALPFEEFLRRAGRGVLQYVEMLLMGRATYTLGHLYRRYPARQFFGESCMEELTRGWHFHVDNYFNYMAGYCGGISLGDARDLDSLLQGIDLRERPILDALVTDMERLYEFGVKRFGYRELPEGYISKCHLCVDVRRHIAEQTGEFKELRPREFYYQVTNKTPER
ncbi:MAG: hypothetical protein FJZ49_06110 [Candidatus Verstraetearchaeota archaeon]|nr:hypothetical protein [Candidatus Verstraetearchaeota archaeon]